MCTSGCWRWWSRTWRSRGSDEFERRQVGTSPDQLRALAEWFVEQRGRGSRDGIDRAVLATRLGGVGALAGSRSVGRASGAGPTSGALHLAQAQSNRGPRGRKQDFPDAERLVKRLVAHELTLSFVPDVTQRLWRTVTRRKYQFTCNRVQLQNRLECLLEEAHIKVSSLVSDLLGASARRMLRAVAEWRNGSGRGRGARQPAAARHAGAVARRARRVHAIWIPSTGGCSR